ncbi:MAG TPA: HAD family hydrolase [Actinocrinis sp.]|uniref:HAD family hydrolase n=1 Tax=Actinocrinis sp. TaxID=1920516 RepID=UPI002DDD1147|nr:HAD family hydrolase [Actinocrinis sp.]HEV2347909.1 HAD family hydrolase [Actinocrinis sp.]
MTDPFDNPWSRKPRVIAYDYGGTLAPNSSADPDGARRDQPVYPEAAEMIRYLHDAHGILAILSSNNQPTEPRRPSLETAGLLDYFGAVLLSEDLSCGKPDPLFYGKLLTAARQITGGCEPWDVVHVGDNPMTDIAGPIQHGMRAVWVTGDANGALDNRHLVAAGAVRVIGNITLLPRELGLDL